MKTTLRGICILFISLLVSVPAFSATREITCTTPRDSLQFDIGQTKVSFYSPLNSNESGREIASTTPVRTRLVGAGFNKVLFRNGQKHTIHINDDKEFSDVEDYLVIRSKKGHEMTYPISCSFK